VLEVTEVPLHFSTEEIAQVVKGWIFTFLLRALRVLRGKYLLSLVAILPRRTFELR
jgi:hypothetical protein